MNGKLVEYLIHDFEYINPETGLKVIDEGSFWVWADAGYKKLFEKVEGIILVFAEHPGTHYHIYIDKRYDIEYIKREVEAIIRCAPEGK